MSRTPHPFARGAMLVLVLTLVLALVLALGVPATARPQGYPVVEESLDVLRRQVELLQARIDVLEETATTGRSQGGDGVNGPAVPPPALVAPPRPTPSGALERARAGVAQAEAILEWLQPVAPDAETAAIEQGRERLSSSLAAVSAALDGPAGARRLPKLLDEVDAAAAALRRALGHTGERLHTIEEARNLAGFTALAEAVQDVRRASSEIEGVPTPAAPPDAAGARPVPPSISLGDTRRRQAIEEMRMALPRIRGAARELEVHFRGMRHGQGSLATLELTKGAVELDDAIHRVAAATDAQAAATALGRLTEVVESLDRQRGELERCCGAGAYGPRRRRSRP